MTNKDPEQIARDQINEILGVSTRVSSDIFKCFDYEELIKRDKANLDIFWLKDETLEQFATIAEDLKTE